MIQRPLAERLALSANVEELARIAWREAFPNVAADIDGLAVLDLRTGEVRGSSVVAAEPEVPGFEHLITLHRCPADTKEIFERKEPFPEQAYVTAVLRVRTCADPVAIRREMDAFYGSRT